VLVDLYRHLKVFILENLFDPWEALLARLGNLVHAARDLQLELSLWHVSNLRVLDGQLLAVAKQDLLLHVRGDDVLLLALLVLVGALLVGTRLLL